MKRLLIALAALLGLATAAHGQATSISKLPILAVPADSDLFIVEHIAGLPGQKTNALSAGNLASYIQGKLAGGTLVVSVAGRTGAVTLTSADLTDVSTLGRSFITASTPAAVRSTIGAAASGANADITALSGLTTPLTVAQGGTGAATIAAARSGLGAAASGANADITSLTGLTAGLNTPTPQGRLTLTSGTPNMASAVTGAGTVYYTPFVGAEVPLWDGTKFLPTTFSELSLSLSGAAAGSLYDIFAWSNAGTVTLSRGPAWTNATTRSLALSRVNGLLVNGSAVASGPGTGAGTYLGTIATDAGGATVSWNPGSTAAGGGAGTIGLWNAYNRLPWSAQVRDSTSSWSYTTAAWRAADGSAGNRVTFVSGDASPLAASYDAILQNSNSGIVGHVGLGLDVTNAPTGATGLYQTFAANALGQASARFASPSLIGQHFVSAVEWGASGETFIGAAAPAQSAVLIVSGQY